ncbi:hypothetical protein GQ600_11221 [Phytophthora cactorum]|nr:hypothetical protein GQ600_11221 [Phytophthora cactorum]
MTLSCWMGLMSYLTLQSQHSPQSRPRHLRASCNSSPPRKKRLERWELFNCGNAVKSTSRDAARGIAKLEAYLSHLSKTGVAQALALTKDGEYCPNGIATRSSVPTATSPNKPIDS